MKRSAWEYHQASDPVRIDASGTLTAGELQVRLEELFSQIPPEAQSQS
jgi:hypothetical protein